MKNGILLFITLFTCLNLAAQNNPFKKVGNDLPYPAIDACFDKNNTMYAACAKDDSLFVYYLDNATNKWINRANLKLAFDHYFFSSFFSQSAKCFFIDTVLYVTVNSDIDSVKIYKVNASKTLELDVVLYKENAFPGEKVYVLQVEKYNGGVVLFGNFYKSSTGVLLDGIVKYDGNTFTNIDDFSFRSPNLYSNNDTLFYITSDTLFAYDLLTDKKSAFFVPNNNTRLISLTGGNGSLYFFDNKGNIYQIKNNTLTKESDGLKLGLNFGFGGNLFYVNNQLILNTAINNGRREMFLKNGTSLKPLLTPDYSDDYSTFNKKDIKLLTDQNSNIYMISSVGRTFNGINYNMVKFQLDSLSTFGVDSIYLRTFGDKNNDGKFNAGDETHSGIGSIIINNRFPLYNFSGSDYIKLYFPDYRTYNLSAIWDIYEPNCYEMPIPGSYTTNNLVPGKTLDTLEFAMKEKVSGSDKQINFVGSSRARLNDTIKNTVTIQDIGCDKSTTTAYAKVILSPKTEFISASYNFSSKKGDTLIFKVDTIGSQSAKTLFFTTKYTNSDFEIDDVATHLVILTETELSNQTIYSSDSLQTKMVYSYDPNIKLAQPSGSVYSNSNQFKYTIHFQNEGNDDARDVTVVDKLDNRFKVSTIKMVESSHPYSLSVLENTLTWQFKNINLKPKNTDDSLSKGFVVFEIEKNGVLNIGDSISNRAEIYFDLNAPIITDFATLRVIEKPKDEDTTNMSFNSLNNHIDISIYPNPNNGNFTLANKSLFPNAKYEIINSFGQLIERKLIIDEKHQITIANPGLYFINVISDDKVFTYKVLVE